MTDLRKCIAHKVPVNRCKACWPQYLRRLGELCWNYMQAERIKSLRAHDSK